MATIAAQERQPHAILDRESRLLKARKIAALVETERPLRGARILDIGVGSGDIASALAETAGPDGDVWGVDVHDQRRATDGFRFAQVDGTTLPFENASFDVVLSNHVIEHVGDRDDQLAHLREVARVLRPDGVCYLAVPNRWVLVEPHFKLPFLSWLPEPLRSPYVRAARRGERYDCDMPTRRELHALFARAGFGARNVVVDAMRLLGAIERPSLPLRALCAAPEPLLRALLPVNPTQIYLLRKAAPRSR